MVLMCYDEVEVLYQRFHDPRHTCNCGKTCDTCDSVVYLTRAWLRQDTDSRVGTEYFLGEASRLWKPFTDTICDTSKCLFCPHYSWCPRRREIYVEGGVML